MWYVSKEKGKKMETDEDGGWENKANLLGSQSGRSVGEDPTNRSITYFNRCA